MCMPGRFATLFADAGVVVRPMLVLDGLTALFADFREEERAMALANGLAPFLANGGVVFRSSIFSDGLAPPLPNLVIELAAIQLFVALAASAGSFHNRFPC